MRRVVVTGMGAITPIGNTVEEFWENAKKGTVGIDEITKFDSSDFEVKLAAEVKGFVAKERMDFKTAKRMSVFSQYAIGAAREAWEQSGLSIDKEEPYRIGVCIGSGIGGLQEMETEEQKLTEKGPSRVKPLLVPMMITNMASGNVAIDLGLKGKCTNVVTACATGTHSIGEAFRTIQMNDADVMVAGGTEASITPLGVAGFSSLTALSKSTDKERASIPFDENRSGFVIGEGAGIVVLEELEHAKKRGAKILAELVGYGATCDAYHITSPAEDGEGAAKAMEFALKDAGIKPSEVDYINAHGTGTHHNDLFETRAIKKAFGKDAYNLKVNSTKSMIGHLLGAAGGVEFITCVKSINDDYIHQTVGTKKTDSECDLDYVLNEGVSQKVNVALTNSLGFGGHNATLAVKKYVEG
jgi:3-oxoacyl-[acyl-carrier-protein] synthase II